MTATRFYEFQSSDLAAVSSSAFGSWMARALGLDAAIAARERGQGAKNHQQGAPVDRWGSDVFSPLENGEGGVKARGSRFRDRGGVGMTEQLDGTTDGQSRVYCAGN